MNSVNFADNLLCVKNFCLSNGKFRLQPSIKFKLDFVLKIEEEFLHLYD